MEAAAAYQPPPPPEASMNSTDQITAILDRITDGCLGDTEYCELQDTLLTLDPDSTYIAADTDSDLTPPY
jgi:hypothetical protein